MPRHYWIDEDVNLWFDKFLLRFSPSLCIIVIP